MTDRPAGEVSSEKVVGILTAGTGHSLALPSWLPPVLAVLFDGCGGAGSDADRWLGRIRSELHASGGAVAFAVVHDWQARTVVPMMLAAIEAARPFAAASTLRQLHEQAVAGEPAEAADWLAALEPALQELYRLGYDYAGSYASSYASASAYASANNFSPDGAVSFAESYASHSAEANRQSFADSNAPATAAALAAAYARGDGGIDGEAEAAAGYAAAYPFALLRACAQAVTAASGPAEHTGDPGPLRRAAYLRLADGLADSLARLAARS